MRAVLFDLDGTLHDRAAGLVAFVRDQFIRFGIDPKQLNRFVSRFIALDANGKVWKTEVYSQLIKEFELMGSPTVEALVKEYLGLYPGFAMPMADAKYVLEILKTRQIVVGIVTNGRSDLQRSVITALGFDALVSAIVISEEVGVRKPQREIFDRALKKLGVSAAETIFVGDDAVADIEGALNAGLYTVAFHCVAPEEVTSTNTLREVLQAIDSRFDTHHLATGNAA
ncbi:HAD family hydrolase [Methylophilus flavus]|uniref:HAD family hydrolase n=1 Tax=Methylophilus flavus TaxID=640084 RepID=A0ABW3PB61_9PROT